MHFALRTYGSKPEETIWDRKYRRNQLLSMVVQGDGKFEKQPGSIIDLTDDSGAKESKYNYISSYLYTLYKTSLPINSSFVM